MRTVRTLRVAALWLAMGAVWPARAEWVAVEPPLLAIADPKPAIVADAPLAGTPAFDLALPERQAQAVETAAVRLRTAELGIWMILTRTQALRSGDRFDIVEASLETLALLPPPPAAVPLPAALWLFVVGLLGLVGVRVSRPAAPALPAGVQPA